MKHNTPALIHSWLALDTGAMKWRKLAACVSASKPLAWCRKARHSRVRQPVRLPTRTQAEDLRHYYLTVLARHVLRPLFAMLLLALATGCTHTVKLSVRPTAISAGQKLPHQVALVLSKELADYKHEFRLMGDKWVYPFGPSLQDYGRHVAEESFQQVQVVPSLEEAAAQATADLILIPRAVKAENSMGVWAWEKVNFTLVVEWVAKDRASQNTVWLKTITGDASEAAGNAFSGKKHQAILMQKLFDDLALKTHAAFQEAPELRKGQR